MDLTPVTLPGRHAVLVPLSREHVAGLAAVGLDPRLWDWTPYAVRTEEEMSQYVEAALRAQADGTSVPFAILATGDGSLVGSTRFGNIDGKNRRVEIGWTWIAPPWQRSGINTEVKYMMLSHAFDVMDCIRVELKTDTLNMRSRQAILRLGAVYEGTLRRHMVTSTGRVRDTAYYSIIREEWPDVRQRLQELLRRSPGTT